MQDQDIAGQAGADPMDSPLIAGIEIVLSVQENGIVSAHPQMFTRNSDQNAAALLESFRPAIERHVAALGADISRAVTGDSEDPALIPLNLQTVYDEIRAERARQDVKWGGPEHDDEHTTGVWIGDVRRYADKAEDAESGGDYAKWRRRMVQIAALTVAAVESHDRQAVARG